MGWRKIAIRFAEMERSLIWIDGNTTGWACSICGWRFLVPTLLSGQDARDAYDRLAAVKFREHKCEAEPSPPTVKETKRNVQETFAERARMLIMRGFKPNDSVGFVLQETEIEHRNDPSIIEKARADAEDFLQKLAKASSEPVRD